MIISRSILIRIRNVSDKSCKENQNTQLTFNNFFFRKSFALWDNVEKYGTAGKATDDSVIRRKRFACWITYATNTYSEFVPLQQWFRERSSTVRLYVHWPSCLLSSYRWTLYSLSYWQSLNNINKYLLLIKTGITCTPLLRAHFCAVLAELRRLSP